MMALIYTGLLRKNGSTLPPSFWLKLPKFSHVQYVYIHLFSEISKDKGLELNISKTHVSDPERK